jgi:hypothetical protein
VNNVGWHVPGLLADQSKCIARLLPSRRAAHCRNIMLGELFDSSSVLLDHPQMIYEMEFNGHLAQQQFWEAFDVQRRRACMTL